MTDLEPCTHPATAQHHDRVRGQVSCTLCGEVLTDQHFELDPAFGRAERGNAGGGMRAPGFARPQRARSALNTHGLSRPSLEAARRQLTAIARQLDIPPGHVDVAVGLFKMAVSNNAVVGARSAVLCACLYIVCRRQQQLTPHTLLDFADVTGDSPFTVMAYMKTICKATHTTVPPVDPVFYVARFVMQMRVGDDVEQDVAVYAMKVMRAMEKDWIHTGRRPLGVAAAAIVIACRVHGIDVDLESVANAVRLHQFTVISRIEEFVATPAAGAAGDIDAYEGGGDAVEPAAYKNGKGREENDVRRTRMRELADVFYQLVNEAKAGAPATEERQARWAIYIKARSEAAGIPIESLPNDLTQLSKTQQLEALGVVAVVKREGPKDEPSLADDTEAAKRLLAEHPELHALNLIPMPPEDDDTQPAAAPATLAAAAGSAAATPADAGKPAAAPPPEPSLPHGLADGVFEVLDLSDASDVEDDYVIYDNEARIKHLEANRVAYKELWDRAGTKYEAACVSAADRSRRPKRGRAPVVASATALDSIARALQGRGGGHIDIGNLDLIIPGVGDAPPQPGSQRGSQRVPSESIGGADLGDEWLIE